MRFINFATWVMAVICVGLFGLVVFQIGDSISVQENATTARITDKYTHSAYTTFIYVGKVMVPQYHPPTWDVCVQIEQQQPCTDVGEVRYDQVSVGDRVSVTYGVGRWSGNYYLDTVTPIR